MSKPLSYFTKRYAFVDSVTLTGHYNSVSVDSKSLIRDCNFNFDSDNTTVKSLDGMFNGCINATFSSELRIYGNTVTSAASAFKDCINAKLPVVDITDSSISDSRNMFENCYSAELSGVGIPVSSMSFSGMFRNSKNAFFNDIYEIPYGRDGNYFELFCGCENGVFPNLHFVLTEDAQTYNCGFMFYYCGRMDCGDLGLEHISEKISNGSYMFYSAGSDGSNMLDDSVFSFSSLNDCECMFTNSNFSFSNSFFRFDGNGEIYQGRPSQATIRSISKMFSGCEFCNGRSPTVILGHSMNGNLELSSVDELLDYRLYGHYGNNLTDTILDFSSLYEGSSFTTLDLRGIANNGVITNNNLGAVQNFDSMCKDCGKLENILGYIPLNGSTYESMFEGCSSLSADLSSLFREQTSLWRNMSELDTAFDRESPMKSYFTANISKMFKDCGYIYSKSDRVDLVGLFKRMKMNVGGDDLQRVYDSISESMPPMRIATKNQIPVFKNVNYDIFNISEKTGTVRYNSYSDELFETSNDGSNSISEYGIYSDYAKSAFSRGFYRYGGKLQGRDSDKIFFVMYYPEIDESTGKVVSFNMSEADYSVELVPHGWGSIYNTDPSLGYWSDFTFDKIYAGIVCDLSGNFIKKAYVGNYTRIYHENRANSSGSFDVVTNYEMPVTYFDGCENAIEML